MEKRKRKQFEETEMLFMKLDAEDVIRTSGGGSGPWDPVSYSRIKSALDFGNDAGIQGGAN